MERHEVLDMMRALHLSGMRAAFDEIVAQATKRGHPVQRFIGELLQAEIADKKARSIKYRMTIAKMPMVTMWPAALTLHHVEGFTNIGGSTARDVVKQALMSGSRPRVHVFVAT